ncbi:MAG: YihY/virulence factor BrkB family protein [Nitrospira sp.]|nr:YihY/virulence factor BrkB family protein [Nitrospira sp.]
MSVLRAFQGAAWDFWHHGCTTLAASLAFFSLLSFFPLVFLLLSLASGLSHQMMGHEYLLGLLQGFMPELGDQLAMEVGRLAGEDTVRWVAAISFVWFGLLVFYEVDYAVNIVFGAGHLRHAFGATAMAVGLLGIVGLFFTLSFLVTQILRMLLHQASRIGNLDFEALLINHFMLSYLAPFVLVFAVATGLYRYVPRSRPAWREAAIGGIALTLLWEAAKHLFSLYLQTLSVYSLMYGSFLVMVFFLLWVYYSAALLLFGAAVVHRLQMARVAPCSP